MWLLSSLSAISGVAVRLYYRASRSGASVPQEGPVLLVGNHQNSLLDPAFVAWPRRGRSGFSRKPRCSPT
jgi:1-acyl-sn-glycerol-3-phosphate acyltransferase